MKPEIGQIYFYDGSWDGTWYGYYFRVVGIDHAWVVCTSTHSFSRFQEIDTGLFQKYVEAKAVWLITDTAKIAKLFLAGDVR
jgi:hypothetical protein